MKVKLLMALMPIVITLCLQSCDSRGEYKGDVDYFEHDNSRITANGNEDPDELFYQAMDNFNYLKRGGRCDIYKTESGQYVAYIGDDCYAVQKLGEPMIAHVAGEGDMTMRYTAGDVFLWSIPDYRSND